MTQAPVSPRNHPGIETALGILKQRFGDRFHTSKSMREQHGHTVTWIENQPPDAVVFAHSTEEVSEIVKTCATHKVPVIAYGTGTSLEGHINAPSGGVCIDLSEMNQVLEVNANDLDCVVQPGVTREQLNIHLRDKGLFFPIDPGANASLGGMASTRASGTNAVRYGTMKDNVMAVEAVMADGRVIKTGSRARKSSAGYDMTRLLVGAEGTLGIITGITLKLQGIPECIASARCSFPSVDAACQTVMQVVQFGLPVARMELLDTLSVKAANAYSQLDLPQTPLLLMEFHGTEAGVKDQTQVFQSIAEEFGGNGYQTTTTTEERNKLWQARHDMYWATLELRPGTKSISTDVCVPISKLADCVGQAQEKIESLGLLAPIVGHVGDGNFHCLPMIDVDNPDEVAKSNILISWLAELAISMDGTCTGEHGIGQGKKAYLEAELGDTTVFMGIIKRALDPDNIMNPGKIVDL